MAHSGTIAQFGWNQLQHWEHVFVIWKETLKENWNTELLSIHVIGNCLSGCWKSSNCSAFKAADIMLSHLSLIIASIGWI